MALDLQYDIVNYTPADGSPVDTNFNRIVTYINNDVITRDGVTAMTAQLHLVGDPVAPLDAASKAYVDRFLPIGAIMLFGGATAPPGGAWGLCNGASLSITTYAELFSILGYSYGGVGGNFALPNLVDRFPLGRGTAALGVSGGSRDAAIVNHVHPMNHTHPDATSGDANSNHSHVTPTHTHGPGTLATGTETAAHRHVMRGTGDTSVAGGFGEGNITDIANTGFVGFAQTGDPTALHAHNVTSGETGGSGNLTTTGQNVNHGHTVATPQHVGSTANPTGGVPATDTNMPPYLVINYIMRLQ